VILFGLDRFSALRFRGKKGSWIGLSYATAILVAVGVGFHSFGEGVEIGSLISYSYALNQSSSSLIASIGGSGSGVAYVLHKFLEGFVIGVFASAAETRFARNLVLGLLAGIPTAIGLTLALAMPVDSTVFFAVGAAATIYIVYKLIPNLASQEDALLHVAVLLLVFYLMYLAGLFHSYTTIF
jgi:zinc transporter ZupT